MPRRWSMVAQEADARLALYPASRSVSRFLSEACRGVGPVDSAVRDGDRAEPPPRQINEKGER